MKTRMLVGLLASCSVLGMGIAEAVAQENTAAELSEVIVTGTRAKGRSVNDSPVPVDVLTAKDLEQAATIGGETGMMLQALVPSFNFPRQSNSGGADHVRAAQLRGMSPDQVLVMVNGKRRHVSSVLNLGSKVGKGTNPVDFNAIPSNALETVEVLRDGAGAQYGSDAIAGVVNLMLKRGEGGQVSASYGFNTTDFKPTGKHMTDGETLLVSGDYGFKLATDGFFHFGAEYRDHNPTQRAGFDQIPYWEAQTPDNLALQGKVNYASGDGAAKDFNAFFNTEVPFGDESKFYAFGTYSHRNSMGYNFFRYPDNTFDNVKAIYPNGYMPQSAGQDRDFELTAGMKTVVDGWDIDLSIDRGQDQFKYFINHSLNPSYGVNSPTDFRRMTSRYAQTVANLDLVKAYGRVNVAFGAEYRHENFVTHAGSLKSYMAGPISGVYIGVEAGPGLSPQDEANISRDVYSLYLDTESNVTDNLMIGLAGRYEHYSDFGASWAGKASSHWQIIDGVALRGAISNSLRAPSLAQMGYNSTTTNFGVGGALVQTRHLAVNNPVAIALGAQPLKPEKSFNLSAGLVLNPIHALNVTIDVFQIDVDDRITVSETLKGSSVTNYLAGLGFTDIKGASFFTNAINTRTRGVDVVATYKTQMAGGNLDLMLAYNYNKNKIRGQQPAPAVFETIFGAGVDTSALLFGQEEQNTILSAAPKTKLTMSANWSNESFSGLVRATRFGPTTRVFNFGSALSPYLVSQTYGAEWSVDAEVTWKPMPDVGVSLGVSNLFDNYPDRSSADIAYFGNLPYDVLSPIGMNGRYVYGKLTYNF